MEKEHYIMNDFDFELIADFFGNLERQGPGAPEMTRLALSFVGDMPEGARIADIGCGTGGQTITLAETLNGHITAIDLITRFTEIMKEKVAARGLSDRITVLQGSMDALPFADEELDLIVAEGSIYHIGYERGLREWYRYLKPGGFIAVSEASWFTDTRPAEIQKFWDDSYPEVDTIPVKVAQMQDAGYTVTAHFIMPEYTWWNYFDPQKAVFEPFLARNGNSDLARIFVREIEYEMSLYEKYRRYYGYVFYIGQKPLHE